MLLQIQLFSFFLAFEVLTAALGKGGQNDFLWSYMYSKTSVARTLMARLHSCFELVLESLGKNPLAADLE